MRAAGSNQGGVAKSSGFGEACAARGRGAAVFEDDALQNGRI